ncbi:MAG: hypothetical protein DRG59_03710 [Deltaproteobacteria bacterium]|nr:MAG: hypothetical protein DRG59_03710 [Deltaproteobacteria bacterium]
MELVTLLYTGLLKINRESDEKLGNRKKYIGSSDIAGCPRKVVLEKQTDSDPDIATLIRFTRGHLAEQFLLAGLKALPKTSFSWKYQKQVKHKNQPYRAHIDFLFESQGTIGVLEVKSTSGIPREPYESWVIQLHFQMGLVKECNHEKTVKGAIFAMDLNEAKIKIFDGFQYDSIIYERLLLKARHIWECLNDPTMEPVTEKGPLCAWCKYRPECPAYEITDIPELPAEEQLQEFLGLKEHRKSLNVEIEKLTQFFKTGISNTNPTGRKIKVKEAILELGRRFSRKVDPSLKNDYPEIYKKYIKETPYEVLLVHN